MDTWVLCCPSDLTPSIGEPAEKRAALLLAKQSRNILIRAVLCTAMPQARAVCLRENLRAPTHPKLDVQLAAPVHHNACIHVVALANVLVHAVLGLGLHLGAGQ
jgi:hypothetical protein